MQGVFYTRQRMIRRIVSRITGMHIIMELFTVRTAITRVLLPCVHILYMIGRSIARSIAFVNTRFSDFKRQR